MFFDNSNNEIKLIEKSNIKNTETTKKNTETTKKILKLQYKLYLVKKELFILVLKVVNTMKIKKYILNKNEFKSFFNII